MIGEEIKGLDLGQFDPMDVPDEVTRAALDPGLVAPADARLVQVEFYDRNQKVRRLVPATEWEEELEVVEAFLEPGSPEDSEFRKLGHMKVTLSTKVVEGFRPSKNVGKKVQRQFLDLYMNLLHVNYDVLEALKNEINSKYPKGVPTPPELIPSVMAKRLKFETHENLRFLAALLKATGNGDRVIRGANGVESFGNLKSISDLFFNDGEGFTKVAFEATIRKGKPGRREGSELEEIIKVRQSGSAIVG